MRRFIPALLLLLFFLTGQVVAQDFEFGKITSSDISLTSKKLDSNANAMVIREYGTAFINYAMGDYFVDYYYHVKIKVFNKDGFNKGNIEIPLMIHKDMDDEVNDLKATTFTNLNGITTRTELNKSNIFTEKVNKYYKLMKFTMPNLSEGSIIEFSYKMKIPRIDNFHSWDFQSDIPKLHSEYVARIPAMFNYNASLRGGRKLTSQTNVLEQGCFMIGATGMDCSKITYIMKDVPALVEEEYMTSPSNYRASIRYELAVFETPVGQKINLRKDWSDIEKELSIEKSFGSQIKRQDLFKDLLPKIIGNATDDLSKARAIYYYISKNIKANGFNGIYSMSTIKTALESHSGNVADINLALIAALKAAGLDAEAVILSTRENGTVNELFPVLNNYNYVIAKLNIGEEVYLLDGSAPYLPFGLLPLYCINGKARVIGQKKSYWLDVKANQKRSTIYQLTGEINPQGKLEGSLVIYSLGYDALNKRKEILSASSIDDYVEKLDERMTQFNILNHKIENIDSLDNSLTETYEISMNVFDGAKVDQLFFNPYFISHVTKNPFNLNERSYPVDFGAASSEKVIMRIKLPEKFELAEKPKNTNISMEENGGKYSSTATFENNTLNFNQSLQIGRPVYLPEEYLALKEFFNHIIQSQKSDLVFKKGK
ncbi:transglutaminase domain-containing protein [Pedobacter sp. PWIIR3]